MTTKRWIGLDLGDRRIGVAVSDPLGLTAQPHAVWEKKKGFDLLGKIEELLQNFPAERVYIGLPKSMEGSETLQTRKVRRRAQGLAKRLAIPVYFVDERLTTKQAQEILLSGDVRREKRKRVVDKLAAAILLQAVLDGAPAQRVEKDL